MTKNVDTEKKLNLNQITSELILAPERMQEIFDAALEGWNRAYNREEFIKKLNLFINTTEKNKIISRDLIYYFITVRKAGKSLLTAYHFFNSDSSPRLLQNQRQIKKLSKILKLLGQLKDTHQKRPSNQIKKKNLSVAKELRRHVLTQKIMSLDFVSTTSDLYVSRLKQTIMSLVIKKNIFLVPEFHEIKKNFKHINNLLELLYLVDPQNKRVLKLSKHSKSVYINFCKIHDEHAVLKIFKFWRYKKKKIRVSNTIKKEVTNFVNALMSNA